MTMNPKGCMILPTNVSMRTSTCTTLLHTLFSSCATLDPMDSALSWAWHAEGQNSRQDVFHQQFMISSIRMCVCT